ncbi:alpha/beta hydrolase-fold protein [Mucilaginibacter flavidus]|uniref:alpha/beta hydrolase-fold protein n=1 Tax=Mucilaginibacter flavidus TaxID=2949309 RepID=UPI0020938AEA|nr:alpha/beta hydrolase-fold protein [Mucilaginibacter flavidus]MCO5946465.1 alpha/beta hydrolase-fold protein [Mucilaginibacter flavidus]
MRIFTTLLFCAICISAMGQKPDNRIVIGAVDTIFSKVLNEKRALLMHIPDGGKDERYPVLYILDGEDHFNSAVGIVQQMAGVIPDMIIVGITNTVRQRDLTPTPVAGDNVSGGGEKFIRFITDELFPYVDSHYPTAPYRVFSGHSLGGLTVVNTLVNHTGLFNAYIVIDPSLWWDNKKLLKQAQQQLSTLNIAKKSLFVAFANNMTPGTDTITVMQDTLNPRTNVTRSVLPFIKALKEAKPRGLNWSYKFYPNERHGTIELNAEYDALRYLFNYYPFLTSPFACHSELNIDSVLSAHFKMLSDRFGYTVVPPESLVNSLAYYCWGSKKTKEAFSLFKRNIDIHPQSGNAFDSIGDFYAGTGEKQKAIEAYTKSLSLRETADTRRKLEELRKK